MEQDKGDRLERQKIRDEIGNTEKQKSPEGREVIRRLSIKLNENERSLCTNAGKILSKLGIRLADNVLSESASQYLRGQYSPTAKRPHADSGDPVVIY